MRKILVSACLLGERVRYDGGSKPSADAVLARWVCEGRVVPVCPEVAGGLPVPRPPAEIVAGSGADVLAGTARVLSVLHADVTAAFVAGAHRALELAREHGIAIAILKQRSPSCGSRAIYDGTFSGAHREGEGVTAALLRAHGVEVFGEDELEAAASRVDALEAE